MTIGPGETMSGHPKVGGYYSHQAFLYFSHLWTHPATGTTFALRNAYYWKGRDL